MLMVPPTIRNDASDPGGVVAASAASVGSGVGVPSSSVAVGDGLGVALDGLGVGDALGDGDGEDVGWSSTGGGCVGCGAGRSVGIGAGRGVGAGGGVGAAVGCGDGEGVGGGGSVTVTIGPVSGSGCGSLVEATKVTCQVPAGSVAEPCQVPSFALPLTLVRGTATLPTCAETAPAGCDGLAVEV